MVTNYDFVLEVFLAINMSIFDMLFSIQIFLRRDAEYLFLVSLNVDCLAQNNLMCQDYNSIQSRLEAPSAYRSLLYGYTSASRTVANNPETQLNFDRRYLDKKKPAPNLWLRSERPHYSNKDPLDTKNRPLQEHASYYLLQPCHCRSSHLTILRSSFEKSEKRVSWLLRDRVLRFLTLQVPQRMSNGYAGPYTRLLMSAIVLGDHWRRPRRVIKPHCLCVLCALREIL